jgi:hypothetical protein
MDTEKRGRDLGQVSDGDGVAERRGSSRETHAKCKVDKAGYCLVAEFLIQHSRADYGLGHISLSPGTTSRVEPTGQGEEDELRRNNLLPHNQRSRS